MVRKFARVKDVVHSFIPDVPDVSLCGAKKSKRAKFYDEPPSRTRDCKECEELWEEAKKKGAVLMEVQVGDIWELKSGARYIVEAVDENNYYCRKMK